MTRFAVQAMWNRCAATVAAVHWRLEQPEEHPLAQLRRYDLPHGVTLPGGELVPGDNKTARAGLAAQATSLLVPMARLRATGPARRWGPGGGGGEQKDRSRTSAKQAQLSHQP
jgi:hypothetical protein